MMFSIKLPSLDFLSGGKPLNLFAPNEINFCQKRQIDGKNPKSWKSNLNLSQDGDLNWDKLDLSWTRIKWI